MAGERRALLIATDAYDDPGLTRLRAPTGDVQAFVGVLADESIGGFNVEPPLENQTTGEIKLRIEQFFDQARPDDLLLLYLSGHGVLSKTRELFFATRNTRLTLLNATAVEDRFIHTVMNQSRARSIVLVLDCCHSGAFPKGLAPKGAPSVDVLQRFQGRGRVTLTASDKLQYAFEEIEADAAAGTSIKELGKSVPRSLFTHYMVEGLRTGDADANSDGRISIDELYDYVFTRVRERTPHQTPCKSATGYGDIFIAKSSHIEPKPALLAPDLLARVKHPRPAVRIGAVAELEDLLCGPDPGLALTAHDWLVHIRDTDIPRVARVARQIVIDPTPLLWYERAVAWVWQRARQHQRFGAAFAAVFVGVFVGTIAIWPGSAPAVISQAAIDRAAGPVTYCTGADTVTSKDGRRTQHAQALANFSKLPGNAVTAKLMPFSADASLQHEQFSRDQRAAGRCDVFYSDVTWTAEFAHNKWLVDLSPYFGSSLPSYVPAMQAAAMFDGKMYGVPKQADAGLLYYRKDVFPTAPLTWQDLYREAAPGNRMRYGAQDYEGLTVAFLELAYAAGAAPVVTVDQKANLEQHQVLAALQFMVDGIARQAVPRVVVDQREASSLDAFGKRRAYFMRNWSPASAALQDPKYRAVAGRVGVAPLPVWLNLPRASVLGGHVLVVSSRSNHRAAALKLVQYLTSPAVIKSDAIDFSLAPARMDLWNDGQVQQALPAFGDLKQAVFGAQSRPVTPNYAAVSESISKYVNIALRLEMAPKDALDIANYELGRALNAANAP